MARKRTGKGPALTLEQADQMLSNVFDICNVAPNTIPLETLESYSNYRAERFTFQRFLIVLIMIVFLLVPFLFVAPHMVAENVTAAGESPEYRVSVHSLFPITSVTASIDGENVPLFEVGDNVYKVQPSATGTMILTASSANKQIYQLEVDVFAERHDKEAPKLLKNEVSDNLVYLYLSDNKSGIDYSSAYGLYNDGERIEPATFNSSENYVVFEYPRDDLNFYISDKEGNTLQLVVTVD